MDNEWSIVKKTKKNCKNNKYDTADNDGPEHSSHPNRHDNITTLTYLKKNGQINENHYSSDCKFNHSDDRKFNHSDDRKFNHSDDRKFNDQKTKNVHLNKNSHYKDKKHIYSKNKNYHCTKNSNSDFSYNVFNKDHIHKQKIFFPNLENKNINNQKIISDSNSKNAQNHTVNNNDNVQTNGRYNINKKNENNNDAALPNNNKSYNDCNKSQSDNDNVNEDNKYSQINIGDNLTFEDTYVLWTHDISDKDWSLSSYKKVYIVNNVSNFWKMFNCFERLPIQIKDFFFMKHPIVPKWEDEHNKYGGVCSIRVEPNIFLDIWQDICIGMICRTLNTDSNDINGLSFHFKSHNKKNWIFIKIWNKNCKIDFIKSLNGDIFKKYLDLSIKYTPNKPDF